MKKMHFAYIGLAIVVLLLVIAIFFIGGTQSAQSESSGQQATKAITDMSGRTVVVPLHINKVLTTHPRATTLVYMLAPDKLMGWQGSPSNNTKYMLEKYRDLPSVGGWYATNTGNYETFLSMNPDAVFECYLSEDHVNDMDVVIDRQNHLNPIPLIEINDTSNIRNYTPAIRFLGDVLDEQENADALIDFYNKVYSNVTDVVATIPQSEKKRVYYAEGPQGLNTEPPSSWHTQLINICGGINVANVSLQTGEGMTPVSLEQVLLWDPDVIITDNEVFYKNVYTDPNWQTLKAVKNKEIYLAPSDPFGWFDRPPGINLIIGIPWTAKVLYPDRFQDLDMQNLTKEFYSKFYHYNLTDEDVTNLLSTSLLK